MVGSMDIMQNYARIIDNTAVETWTPFIEGLTPADAFHPSLACQFSPVPADVTPNSSYAPNTDTWTIAPVPEVTPAPEPVTPAAIRRAEIGAELAAIDGASARPLRAILAATTSGGAADPADVARLVELEAQAKALREELVALDA